MAVKYFCDRCNRVVDNASKFCTIYLESQDKYPGRNTSQWDVCIYCYSSIQKFLKDATTVITHDAGMKGADA